MNITISSRIFLIAALVLVISPLSDARSAYGVSGPRGGVAVGKHRTAVATPRGVAVKGPNGTAVARRAPLPRGYIHTVPVGYRRIAYRGYNCYFVSGVYYRAIIYEGATVYVVVT